MYVFVLCGLWVCTQLTNFQNAPDRCFAEVSIRSKTEAWFKRSDGRVIKLRHQKMALTG